MVSIIGYFFFGSKPGGFTIQPWIFMPSAVGYQISSTWPNVLPERMSSLTALINFGVGFLTLKIATSLGRSDVDITPTIVVPALSIDAMLSICEPFVSGRGSPPASGWKYTL